MIQISMKKKTLSFSDRLKLYRYSKDLTQEKAAIKIGIKRSLLGAYEEGRAEPRISTLIEMSRVYEVSIEELITGKEQNYIGDPKIIDADTARKIEMVKYLLKEIYLRIHGNLDRL